MSEDQWEVLEEVPGALQAEIMRGVLEAQEIPVVLSQEGIGHVYGLTVGPLGSVQILVPAKDFARASQILDDYYSNALEQGGAEDLKGEEAEDFEGEDFDDDLSSIDDSSREGL